MHHVWDVFISYSHQDREHALRVESALEAAGLRVWRDHKLRSGREFTKQLKKAIDDSRATLGLVSDNYQNSNFCLEERAYADKRWLGVLIEQNLRLTPEMERSKTTLHEFDVPQTVSAVRAHLDELHRVSMGESSYLTCDRDEAWAVLNDPSNGTLPRLVLVSGDDCQAHDKLLERTRLFNALVGGQEPNEANGNRVSRLCQAYRLHWRGKQGPAPQERVRMFFTAMGVSDQDFSAESHDRIVRNLLKARTDHRVLVLLLHREATVDLDAPTEDHRLLGYYDWLSNLPEMRGVGVVCVQPIHWKSWSNPLDLVWNAWRRRSRAGQLCAELATRLDRRGWEVVSAPTLSPITRKDLKKYARDQEFEEKEFVRLTYHGRRSDSTLRAIQEYHAKHPSTGDEE